MSPTRRTLIAIGSFAVGAIVVTSFLRFLIPPSLTVPPEGKESRAQAVDTCKETSDKDSCVIRSYETYAKQFGTKAALEEVHRAIKLDPTLGGVCHNVMHHIGHVALLEFGSFKAAYDEGNYDCGNGYFHGVVEEVFRDEGEEEFSPARLASFCDAVKAEATTTKDYALLNCVHGLGHVLVYKYDGELRSALPSCMSLKEDRERTECIAGAFMENMIERLPLSEQSDPKKNPSLTCSSASGDLYRCWSGLAGFVLALKLGDTSEATSFCRGFDSPLYREACGEGIGKAVGIGREGDTAAQTAYCSLHVGEFASFCMRGADASALPERSPFYSPAFGLLEWPDATGTDPLIGGVEPMKE